MIGKPGHLYLKRPDVDTDDRVRPLWGEKMNNEKLFGLYYKYIEDNPELGEILKNLKIDKTRYLQFLSDILSQAKSKASWDI